MARRHNGRSATGRKKDQARRKEPERRIDPTLAARLRLKSLLARMGLLQAYEAMPSTIRAQFFENRAPEPTLVFDPSFPSVDAQGKSTLPLRRRVEEGFRAARVDVGAFELNLQDYFSLAVGLRAAARGAANPARDERFGAASSVTKPLPATVTTFGECAVMILDEVLIERFQQALLADVHQQAVTPLMEQSRLDGTLLWARLSQQAMTRGTKLTLIVGAERAQTKYVTLDGVRRPVHPVVDVNTWYGPAPVMWSTHALGEHWSRALGIGERDVVPVYVQGHALQQLAARLDLPRYSPFAQTWMVEALRRPVIPLRQPNGDLLVTLKIHDLRVGYLVVTPTYARGSTLPERLIVRTFLFLTMQRTPEGMEIQKRLKLTREEIDYLGLHQMRRFTQTDLKDDQAMRKILTQCGCGHLFSLAEENGPPMPKPFAAELKQYLQIAA